MNTYTESKVADSDAQHPGGGSNLSASTTRTPVTGVAVPSLSLRERAGLNATAREEEMKTTRNVGILQEYMQMLREAGLHQKEDKDKVEERMDQEEKADKEENIKTEQDEKPNCSCSTN